MIRCTRWHVLATVAVMALCGLTTVSNAFPGATRPTPSVRAKPSLRAFHASIVPMRYAINRCARELGRDPYPISAAPAIGTQYQQWVKGLWWKRKQVTCGTLGTLSDPEKAICYVFGPRCGEALGVARCESRFSTWARNGQYENIFQMGYHERRTYGWHVAGDPPLIAARAAYRYFRASGSDWSPWQCRPDGRLAW